jgi:hypothetical protein
VVAVLEVGQLVNKDVLDERGVPPDDWPVDSKDAVAVAAPPTA